MSFNGVWFKCDECKKTRRCGPHGAKPRGWKTLEVAPPEMFFHVCTSCKDRVKWRDTKWAD